MENNSKLNTEPLLEPGKTNPDQLYLSTCETLARYAYEATAKQQQLNILAQQATVENVKALYTQIE